MSTDPYTPAATVERFSELLSQGRIDALLELYEGDAAFLPEPGRAVVGTASIRAELERFAALQPRMTGSVEKVIETRDTPWSLTAGSSRGPRRTGRASTWRVRAQTSCGAARTAPGAS